MARASCVWGGHYLSCQWRSLLGQWEEYWLTFPWNQLEPGSVGITPWTDPAKPRWTLGTCYHTYLSSYRTVRVALRQPQQFHQLSSIENLPSCFLHSAAQGPQWNLATCTDAIRCVIYVLHPKKHPKIIGSYWFPYQELQLLDNFCIFKLTIILIGSRSCQ